MKTVNRKRHKAITIRLTDAEYTDLMEKVHKAGISQQAYIINAIQGAVIPTYEEMMILKDLTRVFSNLTRQLRGLSTNVNQMAHIANGRGIIPTEWELRSLSDQIKYFREESEKVWLSIRSLINQQKATGP